jgi:type II secretion system protein G
MGFRTEQHTRGFTIVELLIVIVIIGILAAITIVAYNGIQDRGRYSAMKSDLESIQKAIELYNVDNGRYPPTGGSSTIVTTAGPTYALNIPGLAPQYISKIPTIPDDGRGGYYAYITNSAGTDYKLVRLVPTAGDLPVVEQSDPHPDPARSGRGWGMWTPNGTNL